jgi:cytochrome c553
LTSKLLPLVVIFCSMLCCIPHCNAQEASGESTAERGLKISPVSINLDGKNRDLVGWGSYLVNAVADCSGCHTFPQFLTAGDPFLGSVRRPVAPQRNARHYLAGGFCFGHVISSNLTPNLETGFPSNMTLPQFMAAMRSGNGNSPSTLRIMPWPAYHNLTDHDIGAIYQYLSAIPHAEPCNSSCPPSYSNSQDCPNPAPPR